MGNVNPNKTSTIRIMLISIVPPANDCGVRIVMYRHLVQELQFDLHVACNADFADNLLIHTHIELPYIFDRIRKSRLGSRLSNWLVDYINLIWTLKIPRKLDDAIMNFRPDIILTLAESSLSHHAAKLASKYQLPLVGLFLDWFPIMKPHYGHAWTRGLLSRRFRTLYQQCDLAFCTSDGMQKLLGEHRNSHVIYPIPGSHRVPRIVFPPKTDRFRLVYVGSVEKFYGRMICSLIEAIEDLIDLEFIVVGPNADWPAELLQCARDKGFYLGFKPPEEAAEVIAGADALLVVMSFEVEHRIFMETSFTTKFLDYSAYGKPIIVWGPEYSTPVQLVRREGGAALVVTPDPDGVISICRIMASDAQAREKFTSQAKHLHESLFSPLRLQAIFTSEIKRLLKNKQKKT